jgi:hypothetical protein
VENRCLPVAQPTGCVLNLCAHKNTRGHLCIGHLSAIVAHSVWLCCRVCLPVMQATLQSLDCGQAYVTGFSPGSLIWGEL